MLHLNQIEENLSMIWQGPQESRLNSNKVNVSNYEELKNEIPDQFLLIEEVFPQDELTEIWENFKPYLEENKIFPFSRTFDESVICFGYGDENFGNIYYFNFDYGEYFLDKDLGSFIEKLERK